MLGLPLFPTTRLGLYGGPRKSYAGFEHTTPTLPGPHDPGEITRLGLYGGPRSSYMRCGKTKMIKIGELFMSMKTLLCLRE